MTNSKRTQCSLLARELALGNTTVANEAQEVRTEIVAVTPITAEDMRYVDFYRAALDLVLALKQTPQGRAEDDTDEKIHGMVALVVMRTHAVMLMDASIEMPSDIAQVIRTLDAQLPAFSRVYRGMVGLPPNR